MTSQAKPLAPESPLGSLKDGANDTGLVQFPSLYGVSAPA